MRAISMGRQRSLALPVRQPRAPSVRAKPQQHFARLAPSCRQAHQHPPDASLDHWGAPFFGVPIPWRNSQLDQRQPVTTHTQEIQPPLCVGALRNSVPVLMYHGITTAPPIQTSRRSPRDPRRRGNRADAREYPAARRLVDTCPRHPFRRGAPMPTMSGQYRSAVKRRSRWIPHRLRSVL